jgi:hypothetical protein
LKGLLRVEPPAVCFLECFGVRIDAVGVTCIEFEDSSPGSSKSILILRILVSTLFSSSLISRAADA